MTCPCCKLEEKHWTGGETEAAAGPEGSLCLPCDSEVRTWLGWCGWVGCGHIPRHKAVNCGVQMAIAVAGGTAQAAAREENWLPSPALWARHSGEAVAWCRCRGERARQPCDWAGSPGGCPGWHRGFEQGPVQPWAGLVTPHLVLLGTRRPRMWQLVRFLNPSGPSTAQCHWGRGLCCAGVWVKTPTRLCPRGYCGAGLWPGLPRGLAMVQSGLGV